jgi:uncharacterized protein (TIGR03000 family)
MNRHQVINNRLPLWLCCWLAVLGTGSVAPASLARESEPVVMVVQLHPDAELTIDGNATTQTGPERRFQSPPLVAGKKFTYVLKATWNEGGKAHTIERRVAVQAGQEVEVDLRLPALGSAPFGRGIHKGLSTLTVVNGTSTDALVKVIRLGDGKLVRNFYIPQGKQFTAEQIPAGRYVMREAFGSDWDTSARRFTKDRSFSETEPFEIQEETTAEGTRYSILRVTLHKVISGNFKSHPISEEEFARSGE